MIRLPIALLTGYALLAVPALARQDQGSALGADALHLWDRAREVLSSSCLPCHGGDPDGDPPRGGLTFASAAAFERGGHRGAVFDAAEPAASRLLAAISYENPELAMPPEGQLDPQAARDLERWILAGAPWPGAPEGWLAPDPTGLADTEPASSSRAEQARHWWAYRPLVRPPVPAHATAALHPVDAFLRRRLDQAGLSPAPPAEREALLRRASFDLTGLPPTPEERRAFQAEVNELGLERAWGRSIERLLASPHYGEHWGRHWLDLVRYAETNGYERDATKRNVWRYRDWVIRALNADMPYDRFVVEQLAGDELAPGDPSALLATGYYRLGVWDDEPADQQQARADELADIVDTTAQVFLGTTMGCARCHDHKADPITQRDYYALTAWFNNVQGYGGSSFGAHLGGGMTRALPDEPGPGVASAEEHTAALAALEDQLAMASHKFTVEPPDRAALAARRVLVADARGTPAEERRPWRYHSGPEPDGWQQPAFDDTGWSEGPGGFGQDGTPGALVGTGWNTQVLYLRTTFGLEELPADPAEIGLTLHHDDDVAIYLNGQLVHEREGYRTDYTEIQLDAAARGALVVGRNVLAVACRQDEGGQFIDVGLFAGRTTVDPADWLAALRAKIGHGGDDVDAARVRVLLAEHDHLSQSPRTAPYPALIVSEFGPEAPPQRVHLRGSVHALGAVVAPAVPAVFGASPALPELGAGAATTGRRLVLARWIVGDGAFLSARVMANRLWQFHFGRGLGPTPGDFGRLGLPPTHPELLDWLAVELIERDWSLKALHRLLMESEAYRMSSVPAPEALERDPRNELYARFDPRRLTAEQYRDAVLATSGVLNTELFGPSVFPPLPPEVLATSSQPNNAWGSSSDRLAARRSVYVFAKRSLRPPLFEALDQPDPDLPCPERYPTNVPTQALMTLNGDFVNAAAGQLARRLTSEAADLGERVRRGLSLTLGRPPQAGELERGVRFVERMVADRGVSNEESLRVFCLGLYNRNEFLWVD